LNDLWWDARINPGFGTLEIRICDLPGRFRDILGLTAFIQCLAAYLAEQEESGCVDNSILQANKWQAARHGIGGRFVDPSGVVAQEPVGIKQACTQLLKRIRPYSVRLGCESHLQQVEEIIVQDSVAMLQRRIFAEEKSYTRVIRALLEEFWK
jgi:carboxylate-amine ligase